MNNRNVLSIVGVILIVLGLVGLVYGGITYTSRTNVIDAGPLQVQVDEKKQIPASPIAGAVALAAGVVILVAGRRQSARA